VLRFWNHQLRSDLEVIRFEIWHALMERTGQVKEISGFLPKPIASPPALTLPPHPNPLPRGGEGAGMRP
jgi:hypothetical protein